MSDAKVYRVREGVEWVNGARVSVDRKVKLTDAEARFDLEQGRIELFTPSAAKPARQTKPVKQEAVDDGRD